MVLWIRMLLMVAMLAGALFLSAGRVDLPWFWVHGAVSLAAIAMAKLSIDPGLLEERLRPGPGGTDRRLRLMAVPFLLGHLVVAGLDVGRYGWSGVVPLWVHLLGLSGAIGSFALCLWAMHVNRFFSPVVRIQAERGHVLVTDGPYRWVRHPGYAAAMVNMLSSAMLLGSWWSLVTLLPIALLMLRRTLIEDRFLRVTLNGYADYAKRVRWRFAPGVW